MKNPRWHIFFYFKDTYVHNRPQSVNKCSSTEDHTAVTSGLVAQLLAAWGREWGAVDSAVIGEGESGGSVCGGGGDGVGGGNSSPHGKGDAWVSLAALLHAPRVIAMRPVEDHSGEYECHSYCCCQEVRVSLLLFVGGHCVPLTVQKVMVSFLTVVRSLLLLLWNGHGVCSIVVRPWYHYYCYEKVMASL